MTYAGQLTFIEPWQCVCGAIVPASEWHGKIQGCEFPSRLGPIVIGGEVLLYTVSEFNKAVAAERERCAKVAETAVLKFWATGFTVFNTIRRKFGEYIAAKIREGVN